MNYVRELHSKYRLDCFGEIVSLTANEYFQLCRQWSIEWTEGMESSEEQHQSETLFAYNDNFFDAKSWLEQSENIRTLLESTLICKRNQDAPSKLNSHRLSAFGAGWLCR
jgi:hypothetical protein